MSTSLFFEDLGLTISISDSSPSPPVANYTNGTLTDPITGRNCNHTVTVSCLRELYNVSGYAPTATATNKIGITGYLGQFANNGDLQSFFKAEVPAAVNSTFQTVLVNGACTQRWASRDTCLEAGLTLVVGLVVRVRRAERPDAKSCWTGGQLGHPICPWDVVPDSGNVLLDWRQPTLCRRCVHANGHERAL